MNKDGVLFPLNAQPVTRFFSKVLTVDSATVDATEKILFQMKIPANAVKVGDALRLFLAGTSSSTGTLIFRIRVGPNGTTADTVLLVFTTSAAQAANRHAMLIAEAILRAVGASGSIIADGMVIAYTAPLPASGAAAPQSVNTTADWYISISCVCSVGVFTAQVGSVRLI